MEEMNENTLKVAETPTTVEVTVKDESPVPWSTTKQNQIQPFSTNETDKMRANSIASIDEENIEGEGTPFKTDYQKIE